MASGRPGRRGFGLRAGLAAGLAALLSGCTAPAGELPAAARALLNAAAKTPRAGPV